MTGCFIYITIEMDCANGLKKGVSRGEGARQHRQQAEGKRRRTIERSVGQVGQISDFDGAAGFEIREEISK
jgi:hypothetical protein